MAVTHRQAEDGTGLDRAVGVVGGGARSAVSSASTFEDVWSLTMTVSL